jgi:hypothetical protein
MFLNLFGSDGPSARTLEIIATASRLLWSGRTGHFRIAETTG